MDWVGLPPTVGPEYWPRCCVQDVDRCPQVWTSDMTYIWAGEGWPFLMAVIDLFSCQVVSWSLRDSMRAIGTTDALQMAWLRQLLKAG